MFRCTTILLFFALNAHGQADSLLKAFPSADSAQRENLVLSLRIELGKLPLTEADKLVEDKISEINLFSVPCIYLYRLRTHLYHHAGKTAEGIVFARRALEIATKLDNLFLIGECNLDLGFYFTEMRFYSIAGEYIAKAAEIFSNQNNIRRTAQCFYEAALTNYRAGNTLESIKNQQKSIRVYKGLSPDSLLGDEFFLMSGYNTLGLAYVRLQKFDSALFYYHYADSIAAKNMNIFWQRLLEGNIGEVLLKQGKAREALPLIKSDYNEMQNHDDVNLTFTAGLNLTECFIALGHVDSASILLSKLNENDIYPAGRGRYWRVMAQVYEKKGNRLSAIAALRKALEFQDSVSHNTEAINLARLKTIYELQHKDDSIRNLTIEVKDQQLALHRQGNFTLLIGAFLLFALAFGATFYRFNSKNKSQLMIITGQKNEIGEKNHELEAQSELLVKQKEEISIQNQKLYDVIEELKNTQSLMVRIEKMAALGQVAAGIAHEINNPLNFISGGVDALANPIQELVKLLRQQNIEKNEGLIDELEKDSQELLAAIKNGVQRSSKIISSLQTFSSPQESSFAVVDLHGVIDSSITILNSKIKKDQIEVTLDYDKTITVFGNASQLTQVFINLIDNAIQALQNIEAPRKLHIAAVNFANQVQIIITDNGSGIPEELQHKIFDPFFTTKEVGKGTGLGLAISYSIIEKHKGKITFTSKPGRGTEFLIKLPKLTGNIR